MDFKLTVVKEKEEPINMPLSFPVPETMKQDIKRIKATSRHHSRVINELARQFFTQLIAKYDAGEIDLTSAS